MASYINQLIPGRAQVSEQTTLEALEDDIHPVNLNYLTIFNPSFVDPKTEDGTELVKQIVCFISADDNAVSTLHQLNVIGLLRGIVSFGEEFNNDIQTPTIIQSSSHTIIVHNIEADFFIACSVNLPKDVDEYGHVNSQMAKLIQQAYSNFVMLHRSFSTNIGLNLSDKIIDYWQGFFTNFNRSNLTSRLTWPSLLNYRGFLGLLPKNTYKRSSLTFGTSTQHEIDTILQLNKKYLPKGIIISYFKKSNTKKYGLVYKNSPFLHDDDLVNIYNWLEFHDYHNKLSTTHLTSQESGHEFDSHIDQSDVAQGESSATATATAVAMELLDPVNLANNLVISPLNYTVNGMMSLHGKFVNSNQTENTEPQETPTQQEEPAGWLSIPPILKQFSFGGSTEPQEPDNEADEDIPGEYLIGLGTEGDQQIIHKKLVYFDDKEYSLVIYAKDDVYITLIFESTVDQLNNIQFYTDLKQDILDPSIEEITTTCIHGSINGSLGSLRSLNKFMPTPLDSDFFFVIYDIEQGWYKSSLPYLSVNSAMKLHNAMIYLHDKLTGLFIVKNNRDFFTDNNLMDEYFHKFTSNKSNDWMFYYIRHDSKVILIIKNLNRHAKTSKKVASDEGGFISKFTEGIHLGFLDNLGDDVKSWLDVFSSDGEI